MKSIRFMGLSNQSRTLNAKCCSSLSTGGGRNRALNATYPLIFVEWKCIINLNGQPFDDEQGPNYVLLIWFVERVDVMAPFQGKIVKFLEKMSLR